MSTPFVGDVLLVENLNPSGFPKPTIYYQWLRDGENISGASGATYEVIAEDSGTALGVSILITNIYGQSTKVITTGDSEGTIELPSFTTQPYLTSSVSPPVEQVPIIIEDLNTAGFPTPTISYKWYRGASLISGETSSSYTPTASDVGHTLAAEITATNAGGSAVTTIYTDFPVERADLDLSYISIISPVYGGYVAETINDAVGYDVLSYNWQANTGSNYVTFSTDPVRTTVSSDYIGFPIRCKLTASRSGETDIEVTSNPVTVSQVAGQPAASYDPQGVLEPGSGFGSSFVEKSTTRRVGNADVFASESHSIFRFGIPDHYTMGADGFTLDMYAFHGSGIDSVTISCDGGTGVTAGFEQTGGDTGEGYFYLGISADKFPAGGTFEVRATANPVNGYARSQQLFLTHATGENKISIDTSTTWRDAYDTLLETYDESKRNIIELTESGEYRLEGENNSYRGFSFGWIEVVPAEGVVPVVDVSMTGNNRDNEDDDIDPRLNSLQVKNCIFRRNIADDGNENHDPGIKTVYWEPDNRMWFFGCTFESDWFDTGSWESLDPPRQNPFVQIRQLQKISFTDCHFEQTANGPTRAYLCKNVTGNKVLKDAYTNVQACINSQSIDKLKPAKVELHADHWQNFNHGGDLTVENRILYGYTGADYSTTIQPFFFSPTYHDGIAIVHCNWSGPVGAATASVNQTYDHLVFIGLELEDRKLRFSTTGGGQTGPVLLRGINASKIFNERLHELDVLALVGTTNEFRVENCTPDVRYLGDPESDSLLNTKYQWHIPGTSMASVNDFNTYPLDPTGSNSDFYIGVTAGGPSGPKRTTDVFKSNESGRLGYWSAGDVGVRAFTLNNLRDLESANDLVDQDWYMTVITDEGSMTSSRFERDDDSTNCVFKGFKDQIFSGVTMALNDFIGGVTLELKTAIDITDRARWLTDSTPSETFPVPGATINVVLGNYEGDPTPTVSYVWKKDPLGGTNYSVISGVTGATLDLTANPLAANTSIRCDVSITNSASSETQYVDFGKVTDWNTYRDGIFRFPTPLTTSYGNLTEVESSVEFPDVTQASLVDVTHDFRISSTSEIAGRLYAAVWDGSAWSTYESWNTPSQEQRFLDLLGSGGAPSENEIVVLYRNDPGDPSQFNDYPEEPPSATALVSGSGFESDFDPAEETQIGSDSSVYGYHAKSIAHFTTIPYEEYRSGDFRISVMAYHCNDIDRVEFTLNGGSTVSVTQRELNSITDAHEFYVKLDENSFAAMGATAELLDIRAKIVPKVAGVTRSLQMKMQRPIRERTVMWVDSVNGSDDTGDGSETNPYQTISKPIIVHQANSNPSGSEQFLGACSYLTVYLKEGSYHTTFEGVSGVGYPSTQYSYLQIMGAPGTNKNLVEITSSENVRNPPTKFTKYKNLTISQNLTPTKVKQGQDLYPDEEPVLYFEGVEWVGDANEDPMTFRPYLNTFDEAFMYNCNMYNIAAGPLYSTKMINTNMLNVRADSYTGCQLVVNGNVEGTTPAPGDHADVWQVSCSVGEVSTGNTENNLVYNLKSIDADAQLIFLGDCESYTNTAFVNCLLARESGVYSKDPPISRIGGRINHLLLYNCCLPNQKLLIETDGSVSGFDPDCSGSCVDSEGNPIGRDPECECGGAGAYNVDIRGNIFSELDLSTNVQQNYTDGRVKIESNHFVSQTSWGTDGSTGDPEFAGVSYTPTTEPAGTWYTVVYDPDEGYISFSPSITSPVRRNFYNPQVPMDIFAIERDNPSILGPIQNTNYPVPPTDGTFTDLRALMAKTTGVLDLNGSTFELEASDFDPTDNYYGAITIPGSIHTIKNGTIISGRKGSWTDIGNGVFQTDLSSDEVELYSNGPQSYLYDPTQDSIASFATYPSPPSAMIPRSTMTYNNNWWYITRQGEAPLGTVYTLGRKIKISGDFPPEDSQEFENLFSSRTSFYADGENETNALSKGSVFNWISSTKELNIQKLYYRNSTSEEFIYDDRSYNQQDAATLPSFNVGDVITDRDTGNQYTIVESTLENARNAEIYGFRITDGDFLTEFSDYVSDIGTDYMIFDRSSNNTIGISTPSTWDPSTGTLILVQNTGQNYSGSYYEFCLIGSSKVLTSYPGTGSCFTFDLSNNRILYKPENGDPSSAYIPLLPVTFVCGGKTFENMNFFSGANDGKNGATPGTIRKAYSGQMNIINCNFRQNAYSYRGASEGTVDVQGCIFSDLYERAMSGTPDGSTFDGNMFLYIQSRSAIFSSTEPRTPNNLPIQKTNFQNNFCYMPAAVHGQGISLYIDSWQNAEIRHNIFYNTLRAMSMQPERDIEQILGGGTLRIENNLSFADQFLFDGMAGQNTIAYNGFIDSYLPEGSVNVYFNSNTVYSREELMTGASYPTWKVSFINLINSNVRCANNFCGGMVASPRAIEETTTSLPHKRANNFAQEATNNYGGSFGSTDLFFPAGVSLDEVFDFNLCVVTGDLKTAATDNGAIGIRWSSVPTRTQLREILDNEDKNWHTTYTELSLPSVESYSDAYFNEDLRSGSFIQPAPPTGFTVGVNIVDDNDYRFMLNEIQAPPLTMYHGVTYTFDQSSTSNLGLPFSLSATADGNHGGGQGYTYGFSYSGTPGVDGVATFSPTFDTPNLLYYYSQSESGMGGVIGITSA